MIIAQARELRNTRSFHARILRTRLNAGPRCPASLVAHEGDVARVLQGIPHTSESPALAEVMAAFHRRECRKWSNRSRVARIFREHERNFFENADRAVGDVSPDSDGVATT